MKISHLFVLLIGATFAAMIAFAAGLLFRFSEFSQLGTELTFNLQETIRLNHELHDQIATQLQLVRRQFEKVDPQFVKELNQLNYRWGQTEVDYRRLRIGAEERLAVERIKALQSEITIQAVHLVEWLRQGDREQASALLEPIEEEATKLAVELNRLNDLQTQKLRTALERLDQSTTMGFLATIGLAGGLLVVLGLFGLLLRSRVLRPLGALLQVSDRIRGGDFEARATIRRSDEIGVLAQRLNEMAASLAEIYGNLENKVEERTQQLREVQQQLVQAEKISALGQLVSGVAHELNNPLTAVMGFAELVSHEVGDDAQGRSVGSMAEAIITQAQRCARIVANLGQFSRRQKPQLEVVRINEAVDQVLKLRQYELQTHHVTLRRQYDPRDPLMVADPDKLQQLILNLLNNAYDAIRETGQPGTIIVGTEVKGDYLVLTFRDNGIGLKEPDKVFDPFYTTKPVGQGTGLGLSICYGIVDEHGGEIRGESLKPGARFVVTLPLGDLAALPKAKPPQSEPLHVKQGLAALVIDDEPDVLELQVSFLSRLGMEALGVESGEAAIETLQAGPFDLVISDVRMQGTVDGLGLYEWIRHHRPQLLHRFIFVSGDPTTRTHELLHQEPVPYVEKPFRFSAYSETIRKVLESPA